MPAGQNDAKEGEFLSVTELQRTMAEMKEPVNSTKTTVDKLNAKVDELVKWKTMIIGGAITHSKIHTRQQSL